MKIQLVWRRYCAVRLVYATRRLRAVRVMQRAARVFLFRLRAALHAEGQDAQRRQAAAAVRIQAAWIGHCTRRWLRADGRRNLEERRRQIFAPGERLRRLKRTAAMVASVEAQLVADKKAALDRAVLMDFFASASAPVQASASHARNSQQRRVDPTAEILNASIARVAEVASRCQARTNKLGSAVSAGSNGLVLVPLHVARHAMTSANAASVGSHGNHRSPSRTQGAASHAAPTPESLHTATHHNSGSVNYADTDTVEWSVVTAPAPSGAAGSDVSSAARRAVSATEELAPLRTSTHMSRGAVTRLATIVAARTLEAQERRHQDALRAKQAEVRGKALSPELAAQVDRRLRDRLWTP
jgi:hypothetical protein